MGAVLSYLSGNATHSPFEITEIEAPDGSVKAKFVAFGATLTELWVKDKSGNLRNVILGYDDNSQLLKDPSHPVFNGIVGRYAGRIRRGTFSIPAGQNHQPEDSKIYHIATNDGQATLHGGIYGWDRHSWILVSKTSTSVTYKHVDAADEGFPGTVTAYTTHTVSNEGFLQTMVHATATEETPIMLTQHIYWNLDAFQEGNGDILSHHLQVDASRVIDVDGNYLPTGKFIDVCDTPFDFRKEQKIGARWKDTTDLCGKGCQGYNSAWVYDRSEESSPGVSLWSDISGIRVDMSTNQPTAMIYTSYWLDTPRKLVHGGPSLKYTKYSAVAIEHQGYMDAINTPEWNVDQIHYPGKSYEWSSTYKFSVVE